MVSLRMIIYALRNILKNGDFVTTEREFFIYAHPPNPKHELARSAKLETGHPRETVDVIKRCFMTFTRYKRV